MLQGKDQASYEHVRIHQVAIDHGDKLLELLLCGKYIIKSFESLYVELDEFSKKVKAALQNLLMVDLILNNVARNMLNKSKNKKLLFIPKEEKQHTNLTFSNKDFGS